MISPGILTALKVSTIKSTVPHLMCTPAKKNSHSTTKTQCQTLFLIQRSVNAEQLSPQVLNYVWHALRPQKNRKATAATGKRV
ncbi:hypothetical protein LZ554_009559 [Drepanopeziza brunnea f. sp. 'monogermtubi']|nr:hypothetical protein LZ554_009559 [Drepanopeziza brunnea f. sp. 'monogermtubi']